jgi:hypothetical protein
MNHCRDVIGWAVAIATAVREKLIPQILNLQ